MRRVEPSAQICSAEIVAGDADMSAMVKRAKAYCELWNVNFMHGLDGVLANGVVADDGPGESTSEASSSLLVKSQMGIVQYPKLEFRMWRSWSRRV